MIASFIVAFTICAVQGVTIIFSFFYPSGNAGGAQIRRCQGIAVKCYGFTLGAFALNPSGFCNVGVICPVEVSGVIRAQKDHELFTALAQGNTTGGTK